MARYVVSRLLSVIPSLLVLVLLVVVLIRLIPGSTVDLLLADFRASSLERNAIEHRLGLDESLPAAYRDYTFGLAHGDFGRSLWNQKPVLDEIRAKVAVTLELAAMALVVGVLVGVGLGVFSAVFQDTPGDYVLRSIAVLFMAVPDFILATAVVILPAVYWGWSPPLFFTHFTTDPWAHISQFILPAIILGLALAASMMRITRTMMLEVLRQDYVRTARSKGLSPRVVIFSHALRNALIPVVTLLGTQVAVLLSGSVIVESVFGLPGMGRLLLDSLTQRDYPLIQGIAVLSGLAVMGVNLLVDLTYPLLDPRVATRH